MNEVVVALNSELIFDETILHFRVLGAINFLTSAKSLSLSLSLWACVYT